MTSEKDLAVATTTVATDFTSLSAEPANKNPDTLSKVSPTKKDNRKLFVGGIARNCKLKSCIGFIGINYFYFFVSKFILIMKIKLTTHFPQYYYITSSI
jgi:hypothetical protein